MNRLMRRLCATGATSGLVLALQSREMAFVGLIGLGAIAMSLCLFALVTLVDHGPLPARARRRRR